MKRSRIFTAYWLVFSLLLGCISTINTSAAIVENVIEIEDFESYKKQEDGTNYIIPSKGKMWVGNGAGEVIEGKNSGADGNQCAQITGKSGNQGAMNYIVSLEADTTYYFTADICYANGYNGDAYARICDVEDFAWGERTMLKGLKGGEDFVTIEVSYTPNKNYDNARFNIVFEQNGAVGYVDNIKCVTKSEEPDVDDSELVADGGFEALGNSENPAITLWGGSADTVLGKFDARNASAAAASSKYAHSGNYSLRVEHNSSLNAGSQVGVDYILTLEKGETYEFSAWVRYDESFTGSSEFYIRMADTAFAWGDRGITKKLSGSDGFVQIKARYTPTQDYDKARINIVMSAENGAVGYVDDVSCKVLVDEPEPPVSPSPSPSPDPEPGDGNLIGNSGFELETLPDVLGIANCNASRTTEYAHEGEYSYKLIQTANYGAANYTPLSLKAGKSYYYRAWARLPETTTGSTDFYIRLLWNGDKTDGQKYSQPVTGKDGWTILEGITEIPAGENADKCRLNIAANPIGGNPVTFYLDDVVLKEMGDALTADEITWNKIGVQGGVPVCPTDAELKLKFNGAFDEASLTADAILVNGIQADTSKVSVTSDKNAQEQVTVRLSGLEFSKFYTISLAENSWKDEYNRPVTIEPLRFKTSGRVAVGSKKLYIDNKEVTDGKLQNGTVRAELGGLRNMSGETENISAILVLYCDGEMIGISSGTLSVPPEGVGSAKVETKLNVDMDSGAEYMLNLFVWDDLRSGLSLSADMVLQ